jgi:hypothetical protein
MTRDETIAAIAVMQAFVDGKDIEARFRRDDEWASCEWPTWRFDLGQFRIKPEPRVIYVNEYDSDLSATHHMSEPSARVNATSDRNHQVRKFIEVLP